MDPPRIAAVAPQGIGRGSPALPVISSYPADAGRAPLRHKATDSYPRSNVFIVFGSVDDQSAEPVAAPLQRPEFIAARDSLPVE